jgi:hypothetical protein
MKELLSLGQVWDHLANSARGKGNDPSYVLRAGLDCNRYCDVDPIPK